MGRFRRTRWLLASAGVLAAILLIPLRTALGPRVPAARVTRGVLVRRVVASGRVYVPVRVQLGFAVGGIVSRVACHEGDHVGAGDLLCELENSEQTAGVAQARAQLQLLREVTARSAQEDLRQAEVNSEQAERLFARAEALYRATAVSKQDFEDAQKNRDLARSHRDAAAAKVASVAPGGSDEREAAAALAGAQARLAHTRVTAPAAGTVLLRKAEPGDAVQPGQILLVLAKDGETLLSIQPEEKSLGSLQVGQRALASADAFPDRSFAAIVTEIAPSIDAQRGTVEVKLRVPEPPAFLRPDMTVSVDIEVARRENVLLLPADHVRDTDSGAPWTLVVRRGRAQRQAVFLGLDGEGTVEILDGLREGELVVPGSASRIRAGQTVRPFLAVAGG